LEITNNKYLMTTPNSGLLPFLIQFPAAPFQPPPPLPSLSKQKRKQRQKMNTRVNIKIQSQDEQMQ
jgi:hypothetical protein